MKFCSHEVRFLTRAVHGIDVFSSAYVKLRASFVGKDCCTYFRNHPAPDAALRIKNFPLAPRTSGVLAAEETNPFGDGSTPNFRREPFSRHAPNHNRMDTQFGTA